MTYYESLAKQLYETHMRWLRSVDEHHRTEIQSDWERLGQIKQTPYLIAALEMERGQA